MVQQEITTEELKNTDEQKGLSLELIPLLVLLVAVAFVGFFVVLILRFESTIWIVCLVAAICMGAGTVYFAVTVARSEKKQADGSFVFDPNDPLVADELRRALAQGGGEGTTRHLEHLLQGLALGHLVSAKSPDNLGLPRDVLERVQASVKQHAQEHGIDPSSSSALWSWLMKEGLGNTSRELLGEDEEANRYLEYVVQGLLISYLMRQGSEGSMNLPQDVMDHLMRLAKERAVDQDNDPSTAGAFWEWVQSGGSGRPHQVVATKGLNKAAMKRKQKIVEGEQPVGPTVQGKASRRKKSGTMDVRMSEETAALDDKSARYDMTPSAGSKDGSEGFADDSQQVRYDMTRQ